MSPIVAGYPKLGNIDELVKFARNSRIDLLIVSLPVTAEKRLLHLLKRLWVLPVDIRLSAHNAALRFRPRTYSYIGNVPFIDVSDGAQERWPAGGQSHRRHRRPWGSFEAVDLGERFQVKRLIVHGTERLVHENESTYIPMGALHRLANPGKIALELIEVQTGSYLGEDDIVRFDDVYGRAPTDTPPRKNGSDR